MSTNLTAAEADSGDRLKIAAPINSALGDLMPLIGRWSVMLTWSERLHKLVGGDRTVHGTTSFEWVKGGCFLLHTTGDGGADFAHWMMGRNDKSDTFTVLYADNRGSSRVYDMTFSSRVWTMWRNASGSQQRFTGKISRDQNVIEACWENSIDQIQWEKEFDLVYTRS